MHYLQEWSFSNLNFGSLVFGKCLSKVPFLEELNTGLSQKPKMSFSQKLYLFNLITSGRPNDIWLFCLQNLFCNTRIFSAHNIQCHDIDLENVWGSLGDYCGWPSETLRRRTGAVEGELGDPKASLILSINAWVGFEDHRSWPTGWLISGTLSASCGSAGLRRCSSLSWFSLSSHRCKIRRSVKTFST